MYRSSTAAVSVVATSGCSGQLVSDGLPDVLDAPCHNSSFQASGRLHNLMQGEIAYYIVGITGSNKPQNKITLEVRIPAQCAQGWVETPVRDNAGTGT